MPVQEAMHLGEEERRIYISLTNQERLAAQRGCPLRRQGEGHASADLQPSIASLS